MFLAFQFSAAAGRAFPGLFALPPPSLECWIIGPAPICRHNMRTIKNNRQQKPVIKGVNFC
jgi:hypothetical protein